MFNHKNNMILHIWQYDNFSYYTELYYSAKAVCCLSYSPVNWGIIHPNINIYCFLLYYKMGWIIY